MQAEFLDCFEDLVSCQREMLKKLASVKSTVRRHINIVNDCKLVGVSAGVVGLVAAPFTMGLSLIPAGLFGGTACAGASVLDYFKSREFQQTVMEIAQLNSAPLKRLEDLLKKLDKEAVELSKKEQITKEEAVARIVMGIPKTTGASMKPLHITLIGVGTRLLAVELGSAILKAVGKGFVVVGILIGVAEIIFGWSTKHPCMKQIEEFTNKVEESIESILEMQKAFQANWNV